MEGTSSKQMRRATNQNVVTISGGDTLQATTGALNFGGTNVYNLHRWKR